MARQVYDNDMVAHLWANQSQPSARSHNGNFHFEGTKLYSYHTVIGNIVELSGGPFYKMVLLTSENFSVTTTAKHVAPARKALSGQVVFNVPFVCDFDADWKRAHIANLAYLEQAFMSYAVELRRKTNAVADWEYDRLTRLELDVMNYARATGLPIPHMRDSRIDIMRYREARFERNNTPAKIAARERKAAAAEEKRAIKEQSARAASQAALLLWRAGSLQNPTGLNILPCALRIVGDELQTSWGARVPLEHAKHAFQFIAIIRKAGRPFDRASMSQAPGAISDLSVGHFTVDRIEANGDIKAGCHTIAWEEIEAAAKAAGVWP